jgi:hypothetical protein
MKKQLIIVTNGSKQTDQLDVILEEREQDEQWSKYLK